MNNLPLARHQDVVVQEFDKEILVYDLRTHKIHSLNETSAIVYRHCDGETTFAELTRRHKFTDDLIHLALDQLKEVNLIETGNPIVSPFTGMNRREAIRRVGLATMIALPVISSLVAPTAAAAQSAVCTSGVCFAPGQNICAGCTGVQNFTTFSSTDGSCSGSVLFMSSTNCGGGGVIPAAGDQRRN